MKIYYASQSFYPHIGGVSTYLFNLCKRMVDRGNQVTEVHLRPSGEVYEDDLEGIEIHRVPRDPINKEIMKGYSHFKESVYKECHYNADEFNKKPEDMPGYKEFNIVNEYFGEELTSLLEDNPADVVHIHDFQLLYAYKYVPRGTPLVLTWHIPFIKTMSEPLKKFLIKHMKEFDRVVFSSPDYIDAVIDAGLPKEKIELIHPIANTDHFRPMDIDKKKVREKYGLSEKDKIILCVQRVDPKSGHEQLVKAMPKILKQIPEAKLVFVGGDSLSNKLSNTRKIIKDRVMNLIKELGLTEKVIFTGTIDYQILPEMYNASDMAALCSKNEGFGLSVTEAMSCQNAVVGTNVGGIPLQVKEGYNGHIVEVGDYEKTAEAIISILKDETTRKEYEENALKTVEEHFKIEVGIQKHVELYNDLIRTKNEFKKLEFIDLEDIHAVATDLDRTIVDDPPQPVFNKKNFDMDVFDELKSLEKDLILITGRSYEFVKELAKAFPIWSVVVAENGSILYFPEFEKKVVIDSEHMKQAREILGEKNLIGSYIGSVIVSIRRQDEEEAKELLGNITEKLSFIPNVNEVMILPKDVNKGFALKMAQMFLNIDPDKTIMIGDGENDIDMYLNPGIKVALKNSIEDIKRLSLQIIDEPGSEGVKKIVRLLKG